MFTYDLDFYRLLQIIGELETLQIFILGGEYCELRSGLYMVVSANTYSLKTAIYMKQSKLR